MGEIIAHTKSKMSKMKELENAVSDVFARFLSEKNNGRMARVDMCKMINTQIEMMTNTMGGCSGLPRYTVKSIMAPSMTHLINQGVECETKVCGHTFHTDEFHPKLTTEKIKFTTSSSSTTTTIAPTRRTFEDYCEYFQYDLDRRLKLDSDSRKCKRWDTDLIESIQYSMNQEKIPSYGCSYTICGETVFVEKVNQKDEIEVNICQDLQETIRNSYAQPLCEVMTFEKLEAANFGGVFENVVPDACQKCEDLKLCDFYICRTSDEQKNPKIPIILTTEKNSELETVGPTEFAAFIDLDIDIDGMALLKPVENNSKTQSSNALLLILCFLIFFIRK